MPSFTQKVLSILSVMLLFVTETAARDDSLRSISFKTSEVTQASVTVSPNGESLIFTMLGHLFQLPVGGGVAEQLTFGPHYDADPAFSPDGKHLAFVSDRDGSEGNVFLLELNTGEIIQLTHANWVGRPAWSPDGKTIAFLNYIREAHGVTQATHAMGFVNTTTLVGKRLQVVSSEARMLSSVFYLPDGRLAWSVYEGRSPGAIWAGLYPAEDAITKVQVINEEGAVSTLRVVSGIAHRLVASLAGDGFYARRLPTPRGGGFMPEKEELLFVPFADNPVSTLGLVSGTSGWDWGPRFAVSQDGLSLYLGEKGGLRQILLSDKSERAIPFTAQVRFESHSPSPPQQAVFTDPGGYSSPRILHMAKLSPNGQHLVFGAAGFIWIQQLESGTAKIVYRSDGFAWNGSLSPDESRLALLETKNGINSIQVLDISSGTTKAVVSGQAWLWQLSWSPDGQSLVFVDTSARQIVVVDANDGSRQWMAPINGNVWDVRPRFTPDGKAIFYSDENTLNRISLGKDATPTPLTLLTGELTDALVSQDGQWLVFRRGRSIWKAPLDEIPVKDSDVSQVSELGGEGFSLFPKTANVLFTIGHQAWQQPLAGGGLSEIPVQANILRPEPLAVLIRNIHILNFDTEGFGPETSLLIKNGRIQRIGPEVEGDVGDDTITIDGAGRFAVPGFFDFHVHSSFSANSSFIAYGVTSLRDLGRGLPWVGGSADRADATSEPIPRYFYAGYTLGDPNGTSEKAAVASVQELNLSGVSLIKNYATMSWPLQRTMAEAARRMGVPVAAHGMSIKEIIKGITLGYATLEHSGFRLYEDILGMMENSGTRWDPTVGATLCYCRPLQAKLEVGNDEKMLSHFPAVDELSTDNGPERTWALSMLPGIYAQQLEGVRAAYTKGIPLHAGTDSPDNHHFALPGLSVHWEMGFLAQAGIPPLQVLRIATRNAAEAVGAERDLGTLEAGKLADIVLLDANPLEDIRNTEKIWRVIKGGWVFDPEGLRPDHESLVH